MSLEEAIKLIQVRGSKILLRLLSWILTVVKGTVSGYTFKLTWLLTIVGSQLVALTMPALPVSNFRNAQAYTVTQFLFKY